MSAFSFSSNPLLSNFEGSSAQSSLSNQQGRATSTQKKASQPSSSESDNLRKVQFNSKPATSNQPAVEPPSVHPTLKATTRSKAVHEQDEPSDYPDFRPKFQSNAIPTKKETTASVHQTKTSSSDHTVDIILNEYERGMVLYDKGEFDQALERFNECLSVFMKSRIEDAEMCANIFLAMGISYYAQGDEESALELYQRCIQRLEDRFGKNFPGVVSPLVNMALVLTNQKKFEDALIMFQKAQKLAENILGDDRLCLSDIYHNIGVIYDHQSRLEEAIDYYDKSIRIREKILGESHPITALTYENMAQVLKDQKKFKKAIEYQNKVIAIRKKHLGVNTYDYALALHNMGLILFKDRNLPQAFPYFQKAYKLREQLLGEEHEATKLSRHLYEEIEKRLSEKKKRVTSLSHSINTTR